MLKIEHLSHRYDTHRILDGVSLEVQAGELVCLVGASGAGKSTLLRLIAGLEQVQHGSISLTETIIASPTYHLPAHQRRIGMVFQHPTLFPHLNVQDNICFGIRHLPKKERRARVEELLALIAMPDYGTRYPHHLSGGQQQRVAIARALAPSPRAMLLDEPFANLDNELRLYLRQELRHVLEQANIPTILVTHDNAEAHILAARILHLTPQGKLEKL